MLFNIYINSLIGALRYSDFGCHLGDEYTGCIVYADDIILLSACRDPQAPWVLFLSFRVRSK